MTWEGVRRVALLAVGSFNPPTIMHLRMLEVARSHLESQNYRVVEGILSPVADQFNKPSLIAAAHRLAMVEAATRTSDWIRADGWECQKTTWSRTLEVLTHHSKVIKEKYGDDVYLLLVVGGDVVDSFTRVLPDGSNLWKQEDLAKIIADFGLVVIARDGSLPNDTMVTMSCLVGCCDRVISLKDEVCPCAVSSTRLRAAIAAGMSIKYATPDDVIDYIQRHNLYRE